MATIHLPRRKPLTYESAARVEDNVLLEVSRARKAHDLDEHLWQQHQTLAALAAHHLGLGPDGRHGRCVVQKPDNWIHGTFNVCIPVHVESQPGRETRKLLIRCPMGHKLADDRYPGTSDEKLNCEAATYIWMQQNCPDVPIPQLLGFGFSDGRHFTRDTNRPFHHRLKAAVWRLIYRLFRLPTPPSTYSRTRPNHFVRTGYLLLDYIEPSTGRMLSISWNKQRDDKARRQNLFRGLSRLILSVACIPHPRIGSFEFHDDGTITLTNRPLTCGMMILENNGAPRTMQKNETYACVDPYVSDLLTLHDGRFLAQPNAANDKRDCHFQMAVQALLRTLSHHYSDKYQRNGPFVMQFSDLHASNILVDAEWNITGVVDLEWMCARPPSMIDVPYWITGLGIDEVGEEENFAQYEEAREEFMGILEEEEQKLARASTLPPKDLPLSTVMRRSWASGSSWFVHCLDSINGMYTLQGLDLARYRGQIINSFTRYLNRVKFCSTRKPGPNPFTFTPPHKTTPSCFPGGTM